MLAFLILALYTAAVLTIALGKPFVVMLTWSIGGWALALVAVWLFWETVQGQGSGEGGKRP